MFTQLLQYNDVGLFLLRIAVGIIFLVHGLPKVTKPQGMASGLGISSFLVVLLGLVESLSAVGLMIGFHTQACAALLALVMIGAIKMKAMSWHVPFSANDKTGWEFDFILFFACVAIVLGGGGAIAYWI